MYKITNGHRFETYVMRGEKGSGIICVNGAAAHLAKEGDFINIASYGLIEGEKLKNYQPKLVFVDGDNRRVKKIYPRFSHPGGSNGWPRGTHISKTG